MLKGTLVAKPSSPRQFAGKSHFPKTFEHDDHHWSFSPSRLAVHVVVCDTHQLVLVF